MDLNSQVKKQIEQSMKKEKRQKFHEGLLRMLYPPPPAPPPHEENNNETPLHILEQDLNLDQIPDELEEDKGSSSSANQGSDQGPEKLTRAQRKRIRRKKLKEAASRRQDIIGPLLPTSENAAKEVNGCLKEEEPLGVRENANESNNAASSSKQNKLKQRRRAKRVAGESSKTTKDSNKP